MATRPSNALVSNCTVTRMQLNNAKCDIERPRRASRTRHLATMQPSDLDGCERIRGPLTGESDPMRMELVLLPTLLVHWEVKYVQSTSHQAPFQDGVRSVHLSMQLLSMTLSTKS